MPAVKRWSTAACTVLLAVIPLLLVSARFGLGWRYRDRRGVAALAFGAVVVAKLFLWPLAVWLMATRRVSTAVAAAVVGGALCLVTWAPIGFAGLGGYPHLLHVLTARWQSHAYSPVALGLALGLPARAAGVLGFGIGAGVLALAVRA